MGERHEAPRGRGAAAEKQAKGVQTGNEKLQDEGQRGEKVLNEREQERFAGGKDRYGAEARNPRRVPRNSPEDRIPADLVNEDKVRKD